MNNPIVLSRPAVRRWLSRAGFLLQAVGILAVWLLGALVFVAIEHSMPPHAQLTAYELLDPPQF